MLANFIVPAEQAEQLALAFGVAKAVTILEEQAWKWFSGQIWDRTAWKMAFDKTADEYIFRLVPA